MLEVERERWCPTNYRWREGPSVGSSEGYAPMQMAERQIAELFKGRRYEDARNIPASDCLPLPRYFW